MRTARSTPSGESSRRDSSPASRGSSGTSVSPRTSRRTPWSRRSSGGPRRACRRTPAPGSWPRRRTARSISSAAGTLLDRKHGEIAAGSRGGDRGRNRGARGRDRRRHRRRPAAPALHGLPSRPSDRGAGGADAAPARGTDDRGDRPRLPRPGADDRPAHRPRQARARRRRRPVRGPARGTSGRPARLGARGHLPGVQRGVPRDCGRRPDPSRPLRGGAAPGAHPGGAVAARARGPRSRRADGDPGVARAGARRTRGASRSSSPTRTAAAGTAC